MSSWASASQKPLLRVSPRLYPSQKRRRSPTRPSLSVPTAYSHRGCWYSSWTSAPGSNQSEDCFFVNVWRPAGTSAKDRLPILVSIFGGGYFSGSSSECNATSLVRRSVATKKPMIFINFNYRTGVFGFLGSASTPAIALNVGLQDQRDALRWIQNNAEAFGRESLMNLRVCGSSVHMHLVYPDSQRTFRAAISSSGTSLVANTPACALNDRPGGAYVRLGNITNCGVGPGSFECLQNIPFNVSYSA
ncbi:Alpha/Beta hydrolase protein [Mycena metata]|uniref:Alpha/Beta hydrolase protein n=1 Tax=Mycena metata TaxID=1033252 RepID=A0AAD7MTB1_9AGAR|nr:Alpha/Beta hydrolase protein [Mycena metata]